MRRWHGHFRVSDSTPRIYLLDSSSNPPLSADIPRCLLFQEQGQKNLQREASICALWGSAFVEKGWQESSWCFQPAFPQAMEAGKGSHALTRTTTCTVHVVHLLSPQEAHGTVARCCGFTSPALWLCHEWAVSPSCLCPWSPAGFVAILLSLWTFVS